MNYIRRDAWNSSKHSRICSDHFSEKDIDRTKTRVRLVKRACPTRFKKFPIHLKVRPSLQRKSPKKRSNPKHVEVEICGPSTNNTSTTSIENRGLTDERESVVINAEMETLQAEETCTITSKIKSEVSQNAKATPYCQKEVENESAKKSKT